MPSSHPIHEEAQPLLSLAKVSSDSVSIPISRVTCPTKNESRTQASEDQDAPSPSRSEFKGYFFQVFGSLAFSMSDVGTRFVQKKYEMPSVVVLFCISFMLTVTSVLYMILFTPVRSILATLRRRDLLLLGLRGLAGSVSLYSVVNTFRYLPSGDAIGILFTGPIILIFLSNLILSEPITKPDICAAAIGFVGVVLVSKPESSELATTAGEGVSADARIIGTAFGLLAACGTCFVYITIRKLVTSVHFVIPTLCLGVFSIALSVMLGGYLSQDELLSYGNGALFAIGTGFVTFIGQVSVCYGLQYCRASTGFLFRNLEVLFVHLLGLFVLQEIPTLTRVIGSSLVVIGAVIVGSTQFLACKGAGTGRIERPEC